MYSVFEDLEDEEEDVPSKKAKVKVKDQIKVKQDEKSKPTLNKEQKEILAKKKKDYEEKKKQKLEMKEMKSRCLFYDECKSQKDENWPYCAKCYAKKKGKCETCSKETSLSVTGDLHKKCKLCRK
jgi:hypothetical protein